MFKTTRLLAAVAAALMFAPASAAILYSTGQDANLDGKDDQFTVNGADAYLVTAAAKGWAVLPNTTITTGRYISWDPIQTGRYSTQLRGNVYDYAFAFNWTGPAMQTRFDFRWVSDDYLTDVLLNNESLAVTNVGAERVWTISNKATVTGNVTAGLNTIHFMVNNNGGGASGLAADFTVHGAAELPPEKVPEPSSILLSGLALVGLAMLRRRA